AEQLGLRRAWHRGDERGPHPVDVPRRIDAPRPGQLQRRLNPERSVEMKMELGLGHREEGGAPRRIAAADGSARPVVFGYSIWLRGVFGQAAPPIGVPGILHDPM